MPPTIFEWGRMPGTGVLVCCWGRWCVFARRRSRTGHWNLQLWHEGRKERVEEHPAELTEGQAKRIAEDMLLSVHGPWQRELVRRARAAGISGKRRHAAPAPRGARWSRSARVQSLLFRTGLWSVDGAREWAASHDFKYGNVDATPNYIRLRQREPEEFTRGRLRTMAFGKGTGIKAIVGEPRKASLAKLGRDQRAGSPGPPRSMAGRGGTMSFTEALRVRRLRRMARTR